jgi:putative phosphoribosyl transferase
MATALFDLLTEVEENDRSNVFDIELLTERLLVTIGWLTSHDRLGGLPVGLFGASTGAAAALSAAAELGHSVAAVVSRGGRPDLAMATLAEVTTPTLFIVGGSDTVVLELNRRARAELTCPSELVVVPGASHLFAEPGALDEVATLAAEWFGQYLQQR